MLRGVPRTHGDVLHSVAWASAASPSVHPQSTDQPRRQASASSGYIKSHCFPLATQPDGLVLGSQGAFCSQSPNASARHPHPEASLGPGPPHPRVAPAAAFFPSQGEPAPQTRVKGPKKPRVSCGSLPTCPCGGSQLSKRRDGGCPDRGHSPQGSWFASRVCITEHPGGVSEPTETCHVSVWGLEG